MSLESSWVRRINTVAGRLWKAERHYCHYQLPGSNAVDAAAGVISYGEDEGALPGGHGLRRSAGYDAGGHGRHEGNRHNALIALALVILVVYLSCRLARHADSAACGAGLADRHVRVFSGVRFFHQHAFSVWSGACDRSVVDERHCRGRRG